MEHEFYTRRKAASKDRMQNHQFNIIAVDNIAIQGGWCITDNRQKVIVWVKETGKNSLEAIALCTCGYYCCLYDNKINSFSC